MSSTFRKLVRNDSEHEQVRSVIRKPSPKVHRLIDERIERSFALEPLLRGEHLERGGGEGVIVAGCCEYSQARNVGGGWRLLRWHGDQYSSTATGKTRAIRLSPVTRIARSTVATAAIRASAK